MYFNTALSIGTVAETIVSSIITIVKSTNSKTMQKNVHKKSNNNPNGFFPEILDDYCADDERGLAHGLAPAGAPAAVCGRQQRCIQREL